jgi:hypothetical protein
VHAQERSKNNALALALEGKDREYRQLEETIRLQQLLHKPQPMPKEIIRLQEEIIRLQDSLRSTQVLGFVCRANCVLGLQISRDFR